MEGKTRRPGSDDGATRFFKILKRGVEKQHVSLQNGTKKIFFFPQENNEEHSPGPLKSHTKGDCISMEMLYGVRVA